MSQFAQNPGPGEEKSIEASLTLSLHELSRTGLAGDILGKETVKLGRSVAENLVLGVHSFLASEGSDKHQEKINALKSSVKTLYDLLDLTQLTAEKGAAPQDGPLGDVRDLALALEKFQVTLAEYSVSDRATLDLRDRVFVKHEAIEIKSAVREFLRRHPG